MEDDLNIFEMEDDLNIFEMEDDIFFFKLKTSTTLIVQSKTNKSKNNNDLIFLKTEDNLKKMM